MALAAGTTIGSVHAGEDDRQWRRGRGLLGARRAARSPRGAEAAARLGDDADPRRGRSAERSEDAHPARGASRGGARPSQLRRHLRRRLGGAAGPHRPLAGDGAGGRRLAAQHHRRRRQRPALLDRREDLLARRSGARAQHGARARHDPSRREAGERDDPPRRRAQGPRLRPWPSGCRRATRPAVACVRSARRATASRRRA